MKWNINLEEAPLNTFVLVRWGTRTSGNMGCEIARWTGKAWRDGRDERVDMEGFIVTGWQLLPPLD